MNNKSISNQDLNNLILFCAVCFLVIFNLYLLLFTGNFLSSHYIKYVLFFHNKKYSDFLTLPFFNHTFKIPFNIPFSLFISICFTFITTIIFANLFFLFKPLEKINPKFSFFAKNKDLRRFKNPVPNIRSKQGIVLGVYNKGLIPHKYISIFLYGSQNKLLHAIGAFLLAWKHIPILNLFINYKILMSDNTLALMCFAPAGTGKTAGVVLPIVLMCNQECLVVNDPKGEIRDLTKSFREKLGKVFVLEWKDAEKSNKWNPLDYNFFHAFNNTPKFYTLINETTRNMANVLIEETGGDSFWVQSARSFFATFAQYLVLSKYQEQQSTNIAEVKQFVTAIGVPISEDETEFLENLELSPDEAKAELVKYKTNKILTFLNHLKLSALENNDNIAISSLDVIITNLLSIQSQPDKTRESILSTLNTSLATFDNANVIQNTSSTDFDFLNFREGIDNKPITLYMVTPASEQKTYGALNGLFVEFLTNYLIALRNPLKTDKNVRFILDEVAFFPPISAVSDAPAITRSYKVSYVYICQDSEQIKAKWQEKGLQNILTNTAFKIILSQNNLNTATLFSNMLGNTQISRKRNKETQIIDKKLMESNEIMSLRNEQILLVQAMTNRPVRCSQPFWFRYPEFYKKVMGAKQK